MLESDDTSKKEVFNSLNRLQNLMTLDVMYIDKAEEFKRSAPQIDSAANQERMRANDALVAALREK